MSDQEGWQRFLPPLCLFFVLLLVVAGFVLLAVGGPEPDIELHKARVSGEGAYEQRLEEQLERRQRLYKALIAGLFSAAFLLTAAAFWTMDPSRRRR